MTEAEGAGGGSPAADLLAASLLEGDEMPALPPAWAMPSGFADHLARSADIIMGGEEAPAWLLPGLVRAAIYLPQAYAQARDAPSRAAMKAKLGGIAALGSGPIKSLASAR